MKTYPKDRIKSVTQEKYEKTEVGKRIKCIFCKKCFSGKFILNNI